MLQPLVRWPGPAAPAAPPFPKPTRALRLGGLTPFTSIDFPGHLSAVLFVQGCPWRCGYCHNPHLQPRTREAARSWPETLDWLRRRAGLIDAVVFSGGEPTVDPMLGPAITEVRALGYAIGLHTAGTHARRLQAVLPLVDWVGIDVKAPLDEPDRYDRITGRSGSAASAAACLDAVLHAGKAFEVRTTAHPSWLDDATLLRLGNDLALRGVRRLVLQLARPPEQAAWARASDYPSASTLDALQTRLSQVELRRG